MKLIATSEHGYLEKHTSFGLKDEFITGYMDESFACLATKTECHVWNLQGDRYCIPIQEPKQILLAKTDSCALFVITETKVMLYPTMLSQAITTEISNISCAVVVGWDLVVVSNGKLFRISLSNEVEQIERSSWFQFWKPEILSLYSKNNVLYCLTTNGLWEFHVSILKQIEFKKEYKFSFSESCSCICVFEDELVVVCNDVVVINLKSLSRKRFPRNIDAFGVFKDKNNIVLVGNKGIEIINETSDVIEFNNRQIMGFYPNLLLDANFGILKLTLYKTQRNNLDNLRDIVYFCRKKKKLDLSEMDFLSIAKEIYFEPKYSDEKQQKIHFFLNLYGYLNSENYLKNLSQDCCNQMFKFYLNLTTNNVLQDLKEKIKTVTKQNIKTILMEILEQKDTICNLGKSLHLFNVENTQLSSRSLLKLGSLSLHYQTYVEQMCVLLFFVLDFESWFQHMIQVTETNFSICLEVARKTKSLQLLALLSTMQPSLLEEYAENDLFLNTLFSYLEQQQNYALLRKLGQKYNQMQQFVLEKSPSLMGALFYIDAGRWREAVNELSHIRPIYCKERTKVLILLALSLVSGDFPFIDTLDADINILDCQNNISISQLPIEFQPPDILIQALRKDLVIPIVLLMKLCNQKQLYILAESLECRNKQEARILSCFVLRRLQVLEKMKSFYKFSDKKQNKIQCIISKMQPEVNVSESDIQSVFANYIQMENMQFSTFMQIHDLESKLIE